MNVRDYDRNRNRVYATVPGSLAPAILLGLIVIGSCNAQPLTTLPDPTFVERAGLNSRGFSVFRDVPVSFGVEPGTLANIVAHTRRHVAAGLGGSAAKTGLATAIVLDATQFELRVHSETRYAKTMRDIPMDPDTVVATTGVWNAGRCGHRIARGNVIDNFTLQPTSLELHLEPKENLHPRKSQIDDAMANYAFFGQIDTGPGTRRFAILPIPDFGTQPLGLRAGIAMPHLIKNRKRVLGGASTQTSLQFRFVIGIDDDSKRILLLVTFAPVDALTQVLLESGIDHAVLPDGGGSTGIVYNERGLTPPGRTPPTEFKWLAQWERQTKDYWKDPVRACETAPGQSLAGRAKKVLEIEDNTMTNYLLFIHRPTGP